jgi:peptidoglycan/LPS O-acetylase OafA/YrhL
MTAYRADIDGLRAIAVLSVVAFHAGAPWVPGGFVGVDVFFVISGYLITKIISAEIAEGRFSIQKFYLRRAKRILPALFVVLTATLATGFLLLTPDELAYLGKLTAATCLFVSNVVLSREGGYFDQAAELKPLLHTWTLSVEEQFYILWPLLLMLGARGHLRTSAIPVMVAVASFTLSCVVVAGYPITVSQLFTCFPLGHGNWRSAASSLHGRYRLDWPSQFGMLFPSLAWYSFSAALCCSIGRIPFRDGSLFFLAPVPACSCIADRMPSSTAGCCRSGLWFSSGKSHIRSTCGTGLYSRSRGSLRESSINCRLVHWSR